MKGKKIPLRMCTGCGEHKAKKELVRVVKSPEGEISLEMEKVLSLNATENGKVKANKVLEINLVHPLFTKLKALDKDSDAFKKLCSVIYSQALLIAGLEVENLTETTDIIFDLISK